MRQRFDDRMEEANNLFLATHHLNEVAQRLQEQNDQLLEIINDLNGSSKVPSKYRYDVALPADQTQQDTPPLKRSKREPSPAAIKLAELEREVSYTYATELAALPNDLLDHEGNAPNGYLTPKHEEDYLGVIDNALDVIPLPSPSRPNTILDPSVDLRPRHTSPPTERDFATQNPVSVHNWLLRHKPLLKTDDVTSERGDNGSTVGAPTASTHSKKKSSASQRRERTKEDAPFEGLDDEIGFDADEMMSKKRKRGADGDQTYRPKGGRSKAAKRKRERGDEGDGERDGKRSRGEDADYMD
ncbi:MAG: hypothetical protein Q9162_004603 [Coniocarpon cinnabarinum]